MRTWISVVLLLLAIGAPALAAQVESPPNRRTSTTQTEEAIDTNETSTTATTATVTTTATPDTTQIHPPSWVHLIRVGATAAPIACLLLAWLIGAIVHYRIVRREQNQFPFVRGSRAPQTMPMIIGAVISCVPAILFLILEVRSRVEIRRGIGGIVDEWQPVTARAWTALVICLVLAQIPWLLARRADTVS
jgi:hypothetical protein